MDAVEQEKLDLVKKEASEFLKDANIESILKNNYVDFTHEGVEYRACRPTFEEKQEAIHARTKKFVELLQQKNPDGSSAHKLEKELVAVYMERGIDIGELDKQYAAQQARRDDYSNKLGEALAVNKPVEELEVFKKEIESIAAAQNQLLIQKSLMLDSTIEAQINVFVYTYLASIVIRKKAGDEYIKAWSSYTEFIKERESLVNVAVWYSSLVSKSELPTM